MGYATYLDTGDPYITHNSPGFVAKNLSFEILFKITDLSHNNTLFSENIAAPYDNYILWRINTSGTFSGGVGDADGDYSFKSNLALGVHQDSLSHVVYSIYADGDSLELYLNGIKTYTGTYISNFDSIIFNKLLYTGKDHRSTTVSLEGNLYFYRIYNRRLTSSEVLYNSKHINPYSEDSLKLNCVLNSTYNDSILDLTGSCNGRYNGININGESFIQHSCAQTSALYLKGYQYKEITYALPSSCNFSYEVSICSDSSTGSIHPIIGNLLNYNGFCFTITSNVPKVWCGNNTGSFSTINASSCDSKYFREFKNITITYDSLYDSLIFYYDGIRKEGRYFEVLNVADSIGIGVSFAAPTVYLPSDVFKYARVYTRVLTPTEISKNATSYYPTNTDSLKAWWWMNTDNISTDLDTIYDISGNNNHLIKSRTGTERYLVPATERKDAK